MSEENQSNQDLESLPENHHMTDADALGQSCSVTNNVDAGDEAFAPTEHLQEEEFEENPEIEEILQTEQEQDHSNLFRCVLLDPSSIHLGGWTDATESVKLHVWLSNEYVEPRIEIRLTIKWRDGNISHEKRPAKPFFRLFNNQIRLVEAFRIVQVS